MSDDTLYREGLSDEEIKAFVAENERRHATVVAENERRNEALNAKVDAVKFLAVQAATENKRREERRARIAASKAAKNEVIKMPTVTERADETADKAEVAARSESTNVTPLWPAAKALAFIDRARTDGYFPSPPFRTH